MFSIYESLLLMKSWNRLLASRRVYIVALLLLVSAAAAQAGTVTGIVHNGTNNNKATAGVDVLLIQLQGGMSVVASTKIGRRRALSF